MRKKQNEREYDLVARAIGRDLLESLLEPFIEFHTLAVREESLAELEGMLERQSVALFFIDAMGGGRLIKVEWAQGFYNSIEESLKWDDVKKFGNSSAVYALNSSAVPWQLETGEKLVVIKIVPKSDWRSNLGKENHG